MTRKRFVKLLMGMGIPRNRAIDFADGALALDGEYASNFMAHKDDFKRKSFEYRCSYLRKKINKATKTLIFQTMYAANAMTRFKEIFFDYIASRLNPCPVCGGKAKVSSMFEWYNIFCENENCELHNNPFWYLGIDFAALEWNNLGDIKSGQPTI